MRCRQLTKGAFLGLCTVALGIACGERRIPKMPEPTYERPSLPPWDPPENDASEGNLPPDLDSFDDLDGQWATDDAQSPSVGAGGAENSSTSPPESGKVAPLQSD